MRVKLLKLVFLSTAFGAAALPAHAQTPPAAPQADSAPSNEGDIVVTARRQSESLMQVPVVVSVQNAETLARYNADSLATIGALSRSRAIACGRTLSIRTSAVSISRRSAAWPSSVFRSRTMLRLLRLMCMNSAPMPGLRIGPILRDPSPCGDSTLITSAPMSPRIWVA